jgi:poly(A) polymerase
MRRRRDSFHEAPGLPSFRVEGEEAPRGERHLNTGLVRHDARFALEKLDGDACRVVERLERAGFEAYLVGGCIRDILLDGSPKDFDIATSARPEDVRRLFRNCRIIGRRFRLAHVLFAAGKVVEVATFRRNPQQEIVDEAGEDSELFIRNDNAFGDAHEDALRRDFTINALFYDLANNQVLDWCAGMEDIETRSIRTIGDPSVRFREDPIRILRAMKFAGRLGLGIHSDVYDAMIAHRDELAKSAKARVFEEILRLMRHAGAARAMWLFWETGCMSVLLPELSSYLDDDDAAAERFFRRMRVLDQMQKQGRVFDDVALITILLWEALSETLSGSNDVLRDTHDFVDPLIARIAMPRRIADGIGRILGMIPKLTRGTKRIAQPEIAELALSVLEVDYAVRGIDDARLRPIRGTVEEARLRAVPRPRFAR